MLCILPATRSSFVRLPDEFHATNFNFAVASDSVLYASTLSAIRYSAAAAGNLMSASISRPAQESSYLNSFASDA